jgi:hypothetical protein
MEAEAIIALASLIIAAVALGVGVWQTVTTRAYNRKSVRPVLQLQSSFRQGERAGLRLTNVGLGPARIVASQIWLDGKKLNREYGQQVADELRDDLSTLGQSRPSAVTFNSGAVLGSDYDQYLLSIELFDKSKDEEFAHLIETRLRIIFQYESLYEVPDSVEWPAEHRSRAQ